MLVNIPDELHEQFYDHHNHSSARNVFQKMAFSQSVAEQGGGGATVPHWQIDQNAE